MWSRVVSCTRALCVTNNCSRASCDVSTNIKNTKKVQRPASCAYVLRTARTVSASCSIISGFPRTLCSITNAIPAHSTTNTHKNKVRYDQALEHHLLVEGFPAFISLFSRLCPNLWRAAQVLWSGTSSVFPTCLPADTSSTSFDGKECHVPLHRGHHKAALPRSSLGRQSLRQLRRILSLDSGLSGHAEPTPKSLRKLCPESSCDRIFRFGCLFGRGLLPPPSATSTRAASFADDPGLPTGICDFEASQCRGRSRCCVEREWRSRVGAGILIFRARVCAIIFRRESFMLCRPRYRRLSSRLVVGGDVPHRSRSFSPSVGCDEEGARAISSAERDVSGGGRARAPLFTWKHRECSKEEILTYTSTDRQRRNSASFLYLPTPSLHPPTFPRQPQKPCGNLLKTNCSLTACPVPDTV